MTNAPWSTNTSWKDKPARLSSSSQVVLDMIPGDVKLIYHPDVKCGDYSCSLTKYISKINSSGVKKFEYYHTNKYLMTVRRIY